MLPHSIAFYEGADYSEDDAKDLAALILSKKWERFTVKRDLNRHMLKSRKMKPWDLKSMLERLEIYGWIEPEDKLSQEGLPVAYTVNQEVHDRFSAKAEQERERRKEVSIMMEELKGE